MPIKGLTDNVIPRFPRLGKLRKGGEKPQTGNKPGTELAYFRFTSENPAIVQAFHEAYGAQPAMLRVYLPYPSAEMDFSTWKEAWAAGGLMHRCDGETCVIWRTPEGKYSQEPKPCPGGCKEVGRLEVILPELITAGFVGYVTLETHSLHDLMNITATLEAVQQSAQDRPNGLQGIEFVLRRKKERISTPDGKGGRVTREKWLVSIEPVPSWAQTYLAMASTTLALEAPRVNMLTGEIVDEEGENEDDESPTPPTEAELRDIILATPQGDFWAVCQGHIPRYAENIHRLKNAAKGLGFTVLPKAPEARWEMFKALRVHAEQRDAEDETRRTSQRTGTPNSTPCEPKPAPSRPTPA